jgi:hypothetical protein
MKIKRLVIAGLLLVSGFSVASAQVKLSFNPEKGTKYEYRQEMLSKVKQNVMGQEIQVETEMSFNYLMEVKDKTPQEIHLQFTYRDVSFIVSSPMMKMGYDSKNPVENPSEMDNNLSKMFSKMLNASFMAVVAPDGSVKSVTGMDAISESMTNALTNDGQAAAQMGAQMKLQFSDDALKKMFEQSFKTYPDKAVKKGDSWNMENAISTTTNNMNMNTNIKTKYTLKEVSKNMATVAVEGELEIIFPENMEGRLAGTQTGTMIIDTKSGLPVTSDVSQNMKGVIKAQGMEIQMEMTSKAKSSTKEVK